ncbi:MAG TPA: LysM domain-containing protein [Planctomycetes bacterium]|nr:LysM domain-containing protein [Planctomycetota bacterium]
MSFIERFGLGALFVLCGLILIVGLFGEDDVAAKTRGEGRSAHAGFHKPKPREGGEEWNNLRPVPSDGSRTKGPRTKIKVVPQPKPKILPKPRPVPAQRTRSWKVRRGDSLARIAQRSYGRQGPKVLRFLARANGMKVRDILSLGRVLKVPPLPASLAGTSKKKPTRKAQ